MLALRKYIWISGILFFTSFAWAKSLYSNAQISQMSAQLASSNLIQVAKTKGVDGANKVYAAVINNVVSQSSRLPASSNGYKLTANSDRDFLIFIVERTQDFSSRIDGGLIHFGSFEKLYKAIPTDTEWAIGRSRLTTNEKETMLETLKINPI